MIKAAFLVPHPPLIIPEVGGGRQTGIQKTIEAFEKAANITAAKNPDVIVYITPHGAIYRDFIQISRNASASGDFSPFGASSVSLEASYDQELARELSKICGEEGFPAGIDQETPGALDHGVLIPMYFMKSAGVERPCLRIAVSGLDMERHYHFGQLLMKTLSRLNKTAVIIASGDLSHKLIAEGPYGFDPNGPVFDGKIQEILKTGRYTELLGLDAGMCGQAAECGLRPLTVMAGAVEGLTGRSSLFSYEGPFGVGYGVGGFVEENLYVHIARKSLEAYVESERTLSLGEDIDVPENISGTQAGVFVSLHKNGELRGCIGTTSPSTDSVAQEIIQNAVSAGTSDPRFPPVTTDELEYLDYNVDVLSPAEKIYRLDQLDVHRYGCIVTSGFQRGLLLPNLEGVETVEQQLAICLEKAGIPPKSNYTMERFEVVRYY